MKRLDELLRGGVPTGSHTLLYGPPFLGKDVLAYLFLLEGMRRGVPGILVLTDHAAADARQRLALLEPSFAKMEAQGLVRFVDAYSRSIGAQDTLASADYVDGAMDLNGLALAVNNAERRIFPDHPQHRLVLDSASTLMAYTNAGTVFRFLQVFLGRTRLAGATGLVLLDAGMHADSEVQMLKHVVDGVVEVKQDQQRTLLQAQGLGLAESPGWVEYRFSDTDFEVTGSFASGRIR